MSLGFQQGIAIFFPLLIFPYLLRVLGISGFGVFTLIQTGIMYFDLLIAFGFGLTATQRIAKSNGNLEMERKVIVSVYYIKLLLFALSLTGILIAVLFIPYLQQNVLLIAFVAVYLFGNLLFPDWYFLGIQQMKNCTAVTLISKLISLALIIILVKRQNDIDMAFFALAAGNIMAGIFGFVLLQNKIKGGLKIPDKNFIKELFKESSYVFASIILAPFYSSVNIFILQFFATPLIVGSYSIALKIFNAVSMITNVVNSTFFPHLSHLYALSTAAYKKSVHNLTAVIAAGFLFLSVLQFFLAGFVIQLLVGKNSGEDISYAVSILQIMSIALFFSPFVSFFFQQMIIQEQKKQAIKNITIAVIFNFISACLLAYFFSGIGMAVNMCLVVLVICLLNAYSVNKNLKHSAT